ncbi:MAG: knotted carbamoyltransferase YgeW [Spirochaetales bacterium]|nr:knotted carbamoyltransferase YgeW [Spirochaetales bacterium]
MDHTLKRMIDSLERKDTSGLYGRDFFHSWDKSREELEGLFLTAEILRAMRERNLSSRLFKSGLAVSLFRDNSTRTRFSFSSAANLLGLAVQDLEEGKSQIAHGETVRETATMISFMADVIGIRDDKYIGRGHAYMKEVARAVQEGFVEGILEQRPTVVNLQCDVDHPTQSLSDLLHLINHFGGVENLRGKKLTMSWAYSPSYGKPLSVPQGVVGLMTRFGMNVTLAHPEGYEIMGDVEERARRQASESGGSFTRTHSLEEAFEGADVVYPKSWAPFRAMERRTELYDQGDWEGIAALEKELLAQNGAHKKWTCTEELMKRTGDALYLHCLPADISGVSCDEGEVEASLFHRFRSSLYKEAGYKPYIIGAMIFLSKVQNPSLGLTDLIRREKSRFLY